MLRRGRRRLVWAPSALGTAGSLLAALAAPRALEDPVVGWWYHPGFPGSRAAGVTLVWVGMGLLGLAWLGLLLLTRAGHGPSRREALLIAAAWTLPLALAPPLFSRDVYSYLAQGTILHLGLNPYHRAPAVLAGLGHGHTLAAVSPFWRHTTAPYGPLFLELVALVVTLVGQHLVVGVLLCRVLDLAGLALLAVHLPRLCRALGADAVRATLLLLASPLVLLGLVVPAHNDLLMAGLLVAGVGWALRGRPLTGVALCALAATIKVPALVGVIVIALAWARPERGAARARLITAAAAIALGILALVTVLSGVGPAWLSSAIFSTPAKVRLAITPSTAVGYTFAWILHGLGITVSARHLESLCGLVATAAVALAGLRLILGVRVATATRTLGIVLVLAAVGGPAAWPWYLTWGLALLVAVPRTQRSPTLVLALLLGGYLVKPNGIVAVPLGAAPVVVLIGIAVTALALRRVRRDAARGSDPASVTARSEPAGSALARL